MQKVERKDGMSLAGGRFPRRVRKAFTRVNDRSGRAIEDVEAKLIACCNDIPNRKEIKDALFRIASLLTKILWLSGDNRLNLQQRVH